MASEATPKGKETMSRNGRVSNVAETSKWSPLSDAIVRVPRVNGEAVKTKIDHYMDTVLYGNDKSPLPVFEKLCRDNN